MKNKLLLNWYIRKNLFVYILASIDKTIVSQNLKIWAYYKLGMYNYVVNTDVKRLDWRACFSKIVAYAALGNYEKSNFFLKEYHRYYNNKHTTLLVNAIAPYMSDVALNFNNNKQLPATLEIALLIKVSDEATALKKIKKLMNRKEYRATPELILYYSNIVHEFNSQKKITLLNKFLVQFGLTKVRLKNKEAFLSINNLNCHTRNIDKKELVSVIMTTYNSSEYINTALSSVLKQSYINLEVIIVDDFSSDNTVEIVKSFAKTDDRINLIQLKKNVGTYVAKNIALKMAKGEFITCHDSDDYSHPLKIEKQVIPLTKDLKLIASISSWIRIDEKGNYYTRYIHPLMRLNLSSLMFRKDKVIDKIGFYDCVRTGADSEYYARLVLSFGKKSIKRLKEPLSFGSHRENSLMTSKDSGYNEFGISYNRLDYWESWNNWHIHETTFNRTPFMLFDENTSRLFNAPSNLIVHSEDIKLVKNTLKHTFLAVNGILE